MEPSAFFHVALKVADIEESLAFYREGFDATVIERGRAEEGEGATAVEHVALEVADKRVYLFDRAPYEATGDVGELPTAPGSNSSNTSTGDRRQTRTDGRPPGSGNQKGFDPMEQQST